ncbi:uncharacterized protein L969DRAFT_372255 [Mixia osmundae IAM 14324]|uniref:F-box domain-containing protein n=1 Tax=Mixia osmundae (strain CBS 9802 / IAM 14324 / JCM 22182 / KY 12970) TaxID=764103 RepID=G7DUC4_MIXOS|nr:uncharacterized protein L969DRAFT_372255 [Mixia osmundae IAM 14324]KEI41056.1 hypothetical protein L969DRAFT_372255 [Mixia osmundae IAM 14324]GAA94184.1 hypothetical protein E5Q_00832 [Mixia osmundae IAM 14324]
MTDQLDHDEHHIEPSLTTSRYSRLTLAPATRRTTVTTTTTTTVHFEPIILPSPALPRISYSGNPHASGSAWTEETHADEDSMALDENTDRFVWPSQSTLDGKRYPLAAQPVPASLRQFQLKLGALTGVLERDVITAMPNDSHLPSGQTTLATSQPHAESRSSGPPRKRMRGSYTPTRDEANEALRSSLYDSLPSPLISPKTEDQQPELTSAPAHAQRKLVSPSGAAPPGETTIQRQIVGDPLDLGDGRELAALLSLPQLVERFASYPSSLQSHILYSLLQRSPIPVIQSMHAITSFALKRDFLTDLPPELAVLILCHLDIKSLSKASRVSHRWRQLINGEGKIWQRRLQDDDLWVGGDSEANEAKSLELGERLSDQEKFYQLWINGEWDEHYDREAAAIPTAGKIEAVRRPVRARSADREDAREDRATAQEELRKDLLISKHGHPFKLVYQERVLRKRRWASVQPHRVVFPGESNAVVTCLQFDSDKIVSASDEHAINIFHTKTGALIKKLEGHGGGVWALEYVGNVLVSGSTDRTVRVWNLATGACTHVFHGHTSTVRCLQIVRPQNVNPDPQGEPVWEPPYPLIVTGSRDSYLRVWKLPPMDRHKASDPYVPMSPSDPDVTQDVTTNVHHLYLLAGHRNPVRALAAHGRTLISGSYDTTVRVWDLLTGSCLFTFEGHQSKVYSVVYDHARQQCASGSMDGTVRLWSTATGECVRVLEGHESLVGLLGLSCNFLVSAAADATLRVWDPISGECKKVLTAHQGAITCFQHDDFKVVSGSDGSLKLWDIRDGTFTRDLITNLTGVWQVGFFKQLCVIVVQREGQSEYNVLDFGDVSSKHLLQLQRDSLALRGSTSSDCS